MTVSAPSRPVLPRLSEAQRFLPLLRGHLLSAAARRPLATTFDVVPIVEDELFGYELVPDRKTQSYLIIGCNPQGAGVANDFIQHGQPRADEIGVDRGSPAIPERAHGPQSCSGP
jgi:hypothetical protein